MFDIVSLAAKAKKAQRYLAKTSGSDRSRALNLIAEALIENRQTIIEENEKDIQNAVENLPAYMLDRLRLNADRIEAMAAGVSDIALSSDPLGIVLDGFTRPNGLEIQKITVPLGVIGIIFEARPNVTSDAAALCLMAGNAVVLRGGKEAVHSNTAIVKVMKSALEKGGIPPECIAFVEDTSRESARQMMTLNQYIDVLIPRGGAGLIRTVVQNSTVPVIETGAGNCHIYVDSEADINMAAEIVFNAKTSRPSVCNACETLLVHRDIAELALLAIGARLKEKNVEIRGDERVCSILPNAVKATEEDWKNEFLDYIIAVRVVDSLECAIEHIEEYSTHHSECIVTGNYSSARRFLAGVDSSAVYVNASTRFTDGGEFGFGAEIGISNQKLHARGPLGLKNLTSEKYIIYGSGQIR